ncbi:MAG: toll/interleukin-1 receptor domain-containing protein [Hyphomonas sp.]
MAYSVYHTCGSPLSEFDVALRRICLAAEGREVKSRQWLGWRKMAADVFLSYARQDVARALTIKDALEELGLNVFFDADGLEGGDVFPDVLDREVKAAGAVLTVWTTHSINRPWVKKECQIAISRNVLIPVQIEEISDLDKPLAFTGLQVINLESFHGNANHLGWQQVVRALSRTLKRKDLIRVQREREGLEAFASMLEAELAGLRASAHTPVPFTKQTTRSSPTWRSYPLALSGIAAIVLLVFLTVFFVRRDYSGDLDYLRSDAFQQTSRILAAIDHQHESNLDADELLATALVKITTTDLEKAAQIGHPTAELLVGLAYRQGTEYLRRDVELAASYFKSACGVRNMRACSEYGELLATGEGLQKNVPESIKMFRMSCTEGTSIGCNNLASSYYHGNGVEKDISRSTLFYSKACRGGYENACLRISTLYAGSTSAGSTEAESIEQLEFACENGALNACYILALNYQERGSSNGSEKKALLLLRKACVGGYSDGCKALKASQLTLEKRPSSSEDALDLMIESQVACNDGDYSACFELGRSFDQDAREEQNLAKATSLYQLACSGGDNRGCVLLAFQLAYGLGIDPAPDEAKVMFDEACNGGDLWSCEQLSILNSD